MRVRTITLLTVLLLAVLGAAPAAQAQDGDVACTTTTIAGGAVGLGDGFTFTGGEVFDPDGTPARTVDAYHAAVFVQSWLPTSIYGGHEIERESAPAGAPIHRVDIAGTWAGGGPGTMTVYFASEGGTPYIAFPQEQAPRVDDGGTVPPAADWFVAPPRVIDAFNGDAELIPTEGTCTSPPGSDGEVASASDGGDVGDEASAGWLLPAAIAAAVVVVGGLLLRWRRSPRAG